VKCVMIVGMAIAGILATQQVQAERMRGLKVVTREGRTVDLYGASYALIVGNSNYAKEWGRLPNVKDDVTEVAAALKQNGFNVTVGRDLTADGFASTFTRFFTTYGSNERNRLLFYYAGHGHTETLVTGEPYGSLVMIDTPHPDRNLSEFTLKSISMQRIYDESKRVTARHALFMFDSCFSGTIFRTRDEKQPPQGIQSSMTQRVRQFITAGSEDERVPDESLFKRYFIELLNGSRPEPVKDGYLTGYELGYYLYNQIPNARRGQHPQFGKLNHPGLDRGDFIFKLSK
jgi:uncharacterized caspase-like protein